MVMPRQLRRGIRSAKTKVLSRSSYFCVSPLLLAVSRVSSVFFELGVCFVFFPWEAVNTWGLLKIRRRQQRWSDPLASKRPQQTRNGWPAGCCCTFARMICTCISEVTTAPSRRNRAEEHSGAGGGVGSSGAYTRPAYSSVSRSSA